MREILRIQKECAVIEGRMKAAQMQMVISIPPKYSVSQVVGYVKGKSAIWVSRATGSKRNFVGQISGLDGNDCPTLRFG